MLIYVDQVTERLQFTLEFIFSRHGLAYRCTNDQSEFLQSAGPKLNYSEWDPEQGDFFRPSSLLFEEGINTALKVQKSEWCSVPIISINGFTDPFASVFYVLSRYEEYASQKVDIHGRFQAASSILYQFGWLETQIVERWVEAIIYQFAPHLQEQLQINRKITVIPTFDIDNTFAFQWKGGWRKWLAISKDLIRGNKDRRELRRKVNAGELPDPYDTFDKIRSVAERFPETRIFWHLGDYAKFDRNLPWYDPRHQRLIRSMNKVAKVGLHPGYASNTSDKSLSEEQYRLQKILHSKVEESRQHFLKLKFPSTYNRLIDLGFKRDFSMGFADHPGFRAGTAYTFNFFDLKRNVQTDYEIVPFVYMDGTFVDYLKTDPEESLLLIKKLASEVKAYGGNFAFIWHNETISDHDRWAGWSRVFDQTLKIASDGLDKN